MCTYLLEWHSVEMTGSDREKKRKSVCFFQLACAGSHGRSAVHEAQVKVKLHPLIPWTAATKLCSSTVLNTNSYAGMYSVQSSAFTPPLSPVFLHRICPCLAPRLSLQSRRSQGSDVPWAGRKEGRKGPQGMRVGEGGGFHLHAWGLGE